MVQRPWTMEFSTLHRKKKRKSQTNEIEESLSIATHAANHPVRMRKLSEAQVARENAHRELKRMEQKERAKADKLRNEAIAKQVREKLEKECQPYAVVMKAKGYMKRDIPTHNLVKRYLKKEKNSNKDVLGTIDGTNALEILKKYW